MAAQIPLIWITALVVLALLVIAAIAFVKIYQDRHDRDAFVTTVCIFALTCLLATVCLFPVDVALVASTTSNSTGMKKDWATPGTVHHILLSLKIVYYTLYSLDAVMCLLVVPFAYFWYEEWGPEETTTKQRITGALKYSAAFLALFIILLIVGFFVPVARSTKGHLDLDYLKRLLMENHGERALTFIIGILMCLGTVLFVLYTAPGLAIAPMVLIKSVPSISNASLSSNTHEALAINRERQRAIEARNAGRQERPSSRDRRELEQLQREERTLVRRQRLAEESTSSRSKRAYLKLQAIGRPFKIILGLIALAVAILIFASMLITGIDKAKNSVCGKRCGYILPNTTILNPINWVFVAASRVFPLDYILALALVDLFFISSIVGIAFMGIRFLWVSLFELRVGSTKPQGLLMSTVMLTLIVLALNYSLTMVLLPQYAHFGGQKYCLVTPAPGEKCPPQDLAECDSSAPNEICTPTVVSTFINRITLNFPFLGAFAFWAQFAWMGVFLVVALTGLVWTPRIGEKSNEELEEEEEEGLLAGAGRRGRAAWADLTNRPAGYGSTESNGA